MAQNFQFQANWPEDQSTSGSTGSFDQINDASFDSISGIQGLLSRIIDEFENQKKNFHVQIQENIELIQQSVVREDQINNLQKNNLALTQKVKVMSAALLKQKYNIRRKDFIIQSLFQKHTTTLSDISSYRIQNCTLKEKIAILQQDRSTLSKKLSEKQQSQSQLNKEIGLLKEAFLSDPKILKYEKKIFKEKELFIQKLQKKIELANDKAKSALCQVYHLHQHQQIYKNQQIQLKQYENQRVILFNKLDKLEIQNLQLKSSNQQLLFKNKQLQIQKEEFQLKSKSNSQSTIFSSINQQSFFNQNLNEDKDKKQDLQTQQGWIFKTQ